MSFTSEASDVLFVCQGNACRSPMAHGFGEAMIGVNGAVHSAGVRPIGIDDRAVEVMAEVNVDIQNLRSTPITSIQDAPDLVVSMDPSVTRKLPTRFQSTGVKTWSIQDPYFATGSQHEQLEVFRQVRDRIKNRVDTLFRRLRLNAHSA